MFLPESEDWKGFNKIQQDLSLQPVPLFLKNVELSHFDIPTRVPHFLKIALQLCNNERLYDSFDQDFDHISYH